MIALLRHYDKDTTRVQFREIKAAFSSDNKSSTKVKDLITEEAVKAFYHHKVKLDEFNIDMCDGISGFTRAMVKTQRRYMKDKTTFFDRFKSKTTKDKARWEDFLLSGGLNNLWQRDDNGVPKAGKRKLSEVA